MAKPKQDAVIETVEIKQERIEFCVLGSTPLIMNRLSKKAQEELLLPAKKKNRAAKESSLKTDPYERFRSSPNTLPEGPTLLAVPGTAFKGAMRSVAIDMPGATKAQIGRLTYIEDVLVPVYGIPKLLLSPVRNADMKRTPDIRARSILPQWAAFVTFRYTRPQLNYDTVARLFGAAGLICGVGDWRPERGSGNYGTWEIVDREDERFREIVKTQGREAQEAAMLRAEPADHETEELLEWFDVEAESRGFKVAK